jgi:hypothetical protein
MRSPICYMSKVVGFEIMRTLLIVITLNVCSDSCRAANEMNTSNSAEPTISELVKAIKFGPPTSERKLVDNSNVDTKGLSEPHQKASLPATLSDYVALLRIKEKAIYGSDRRVDWYALPNQDVRDSSESVAALINASNITDLGNGASRLNTQSLGVKYSLCAGETFFEQPAVAFGTAFVVSTNRIATAQHCVRGANAPLLSDIRLVFGFRMISTNECLLIITNEDIYRLTSIVGTPKSIGSDFAIVQTDRPLVNRKVLSFRKAGKVRNHEPVFVIGYPCGLPIKYADGGWVTDNSAKFFFKANLDAFGGNSGSPVFNVGGEVEGILVRGEADFISTISSCSIARVFPTTGEGGEECNRVTEIVPFVSR